MTHSLAASSRFASSRTMALFLPPSSIRQGLRYFPQVAAMMLPTAVLPVKLTFLIKGFAIKAVVNAGASSGLNVTMLRHPGGRPASAKICPIAQ